MIQRQCLDALCMATIDLDARACTTTASVRLSRPDSHWQDPIRIGKKMGMVRKQQDNGLTDCWTPYHFWHPNTEGAHLGRL